MSFSLLVGIQNDDWYPTIADKLTHLMFGVVKFHVFQDGNKRTALAVCLEMLIRNGFLYCVPTFMRDMENVIVSVAEGTFDKSLLRDIIAARIEMKEEDEALKLRIFEALSARANRIQ